MTVGGKTDGDDIPANNLSQCRMNTARHLWSTTMDDLEVDDDVENVDDETFIQGMKEINDAAQKQPYFEFTTKGKGSLCSCSCPGVSLGLLGVGWWLVGSRSRSRYLFLPRCLVRFAWG